MSKKKKSSYSAIGFAWELGMYVVLPIVGLLILGVWLDGRYGTSPLFLLLGVVFGAISSSYGIYIKAKDILDDD